MFLHPSSVLRILAVDLMVRNPLYDCLRPDKWCSA